MLDVCISNYQICNLSGRRNLSLLKFHFFGFYFCNLKYALIISESDLIFQK